jgi:hypothetical protein
MGKTTYICPNGFTVPRIWDGKDIYIVAGGPSVMDLDFNKLVHKCVLGVNSAVYLSCTKILFFGDAKWYWWNRAAVQAFKGMKITVNKLVEGRDPSVHEEPDINVVKCQSIRGFHIEPDRVAWNRSSGGCAINVAIHLGAKRIILLGYDMKRTYDRKNWNPHVQESTNQNPYENQAGTLPHTAEAIKRRTDVEVLNATQGSALECFRKVKLEEVGL